MPASVTLSPPEICGRCDAPTHALSVKVNATITIKRTSYLPCMDNYQVSCDRERNPSGLFMAARLSKETLFCTEYHSLTKTCQPSRAGEVLPPWRIIPLLARCVFLPGGDTQVGEP